MINLIQGFNISSPLPIDGRILLSRAEMSSIDDNVMPDRYFCICEEDGLLYLYDKNAEVGELGKFHKAVPEKTSQIENNGNGDLNSEGLADPFDTVASVDSKMAALDQKIAADFINNKDLANTLANYGLTQTDSEGTFGTPIANNIELVCKTEEEYGSEADYRLSVILKDFNGNEIARSNIIDLPVENVVMDVDYIDDSEGKAIVITLNNGAKTRVPVDAIIEGLVDESTFNAHTGNTTIHTNAVEKSSWNAKYDKPSGGIPLNDLSSGVKASLAKADESISAAYLGSHRYINTYDFPNYVVAGENVFIDQENGKNIINAKDTTYMAGRGIRISSGSDGGEDSHSSVMYISTNTSNPTWVDIDSETGKEPMDNEALAALFNAKQDKISDGTTINADSVVDTNSTHKFVSTTEKNTWNAKQNAISASNKISADYVDDTSTTHKFVSAAEKTTWNGKQDKITSTNLLSHSLVEGLSTVASTGAYSDLTGKPAINNGTLTIGVSLGAPEAISTDNTFTANQSGNTTLDIKIPNNTNQLTNGANFQTATQLSSAISTHNSSTSAHSDIRGLITGTNGVNAKISAIEGKIPSAASTTNQLADKEYVNSSISTSTATFRGTVTATADTDAAAQTALNGITTKDDNDYAFVQCTDSAGNTKYKRYKYNGSAWVYEYTLNNSSFTAAQWSTINSGITSAMLPSGVSSTNKLATASDITTVNNSINTKQAKLVSGTNIRTVNGNSLIDMTAGANIQVGTVTGVSVVGTTPIVVGQTSGHTPTSPSYSITHATSLSSAQGFGPSSNATLSPGSSFNVPNVTFNTYGHITSGANRQISIPGIATDRGLAVISDNQVGIKTAQITIPANATWTAAAGTAGQIGYYYTVTTGTDGALAHITANSQPVLDVDMSSVANANEIAAINEAWSKIYRVVTETRGIRFYSTEQLTTALTINVKG